MQEAKTLSEIISNGEQLLAIIAENEGEISAELEAILDMNQAALKDKIDAYAFVIDALKSRRSYASERLNQWSKIADRCDSQIDFLESKIKNALGVVNMAEIHGHEYSIKIRSNPPSVNVYAEDKIPGEFLITETKTRIDKKKISDVLKGGGEVNGASLERSTKLVIKPSERKLIGAAQ